MRINRRTPSVEKRTYRFGDDDGVVFVAAEQVGEVLATAHQIWQTEREQAHRIRSSETLRPQTAFDDYLTRRGGVGSSGQLEAAVLEAVVTSDVGQAVLPAGGVDRGQYRWAACLDVVAVPGVVGRRQGGAPSVRVAKSDVSGSVGAALRAGLPACRWVGWRSCPPLLTLPLIHNRGHCLVVALVRFELRCCPKKFGDFDREFRREMATATETLDLSGVVAMLARWQRVALSSQDPQAHRRMFGARRHPGRRRTGPDGAMGAHESAVGSVGVCR